MPITMIPSISGGANLTTAGRVMIVAGPGVAGQSDVSLASGIFSRAGTLGLSATGTNVIPFSTNGTERGRWSSGGNLLVGTTTDVSAKLQVAPASDGGDAIRIDRNGSSNATGYIKWSIGGVEQAAIRGYYDTDTPVLTFYVGNSVTEAMRIHGGSLNVLVGGTINGNYRLDVQSSGSSGTARFYDQTATTGVTRVVVRAGAGQSSTDLLQVKNASNNTVSYITNTGWWYFTDNRGTNYLNASSYQRVTIAGTTGGYVALASPAKIYWTNGNGAWETADLGLARNAAGIIEINNGSAGTYRDIIARSYIGTAVAAATLANSQFTFHLASNTEFVITAKGDDGTTRTATVALA